MSTQERLDELTHELGYRGSRGYLDGADAGEVHSADPRGLIWNDLQEKCGVTAAYFKGAIPVVAFIAAETRDDAMLAHRRLWNYGRVPILIATTENEVLAFSCNTAQTPTSPYAAVLAETSNKRDATAVLADFTRFSVESGQLARHRSKYMSTHSRVDQDLLRNLRVLRLRLLEAGVHDREIEPLLGRSIFVKYLEDRKILLPEDLRELGQPESLVATLAGGWEAVAAFFAAMSEHFSGDVFQRDVLTRPIPSEALVVLAHFFEGADLETGQASLWPYNFAIIPAELISSIYEQLLADQQKANAAYYTPRRVVDLVLDELLPMVNHENHEVTVLDPACGSGIFLTEAFRRLVHRSRAESRSIPGYQELSRLLVTSIFGIDRSADAVGVTAFGLYLALLEHVDPRTVWRDVRLPSLVGTNLIVSDFFETNPLTPKKFDVIVGNPPWQSTLSIAARRYLKTGNHRAPDRQVASAFVWKTAEMLSAGGKVGLVLPSKTVLHNRGGTADRFRLDFFSKLDVQTLLDLSPLRRELFGATSPAVIAIYGSEPREASADLLHVSPRRTPIAEIIDGIAIPQQNIQRMSQARARVDPGIWKVLLWGGPDDLAFVDHLGATFQSLSQLAKSRGWQTGAGFQKVKKGDRNDASHLHNLPQIETSSLSSMHAPSELLPPVTEPFLHRPRDPRIYRAPHLLMRKGFAHTPEAAFVPYDATFTDGLFAISADVDEEDLLRALSALLASSLARYWYLMTSSSWGVEREQLHYREWMSLPVPDLNSTDIESLVRILDLVATGAPESEWRTTLDRIVEDAYSLTHAERQLISDALTIRLSELQFGSQSDSYGPPNDTEFGAYLDAFSRSINALELGRWSVTLSEASNGFARVTCTNLDLNVSADPSHIFGLENLLGPETDLLDEWLSSASIVEPQAIILDGDRVHLVKPHRRSCWMTSSAPRDAADVFESLLRHDSAGND